MSANISKVGSITEMAYAGATPWHKLGVKLPAFATSAEIMAAAHLSWEVEKRPAYYPNKEGKLVPIGSTLVEGGSGEHQDGDRFAIVRKDTDVALGVVGPHYTPLQNKDAFSFMDAIVGEKAAIYETAGALNEGRQIWALARIAGVMSIKGKDDILPYLLLTNGHDGWQAVRVMLTPVRVVCWNTFSSAIKSAQAQHLFKLRHSQNIGQRVVEVRETLGLVNKSFEEFAAKAELLAEKSIKKDKWDLFLDTIGFDTKATDKRAKAKVAALTRSFETGPGSNLSTANGTLWGAFHAVTHYLDHGKEWRTPESQLNSMYGGEAIKRKALDAALEMAK